MQEFDIATIKHKSIQGILALTGRTFVIQLIAFGATFLLTLFLSPSVFGIFFVVSAVISFLSYFSDIGLAAALIQKKDTLTDEDLSTTFTIQQILVVVLVIIIYACSPAIGKFYALNSDGVWLLRALVVAFFISSLKTIPSVLLERKLEFNKLVIPQLVETVAFYGTAVMLAYLGWGIRAFTIAVLTRAFLGLIVMYIISPYRIRISLSRNTARRLLKFGLPFQMNSVLALIKDDLLTLFLGKMLPFGEIGYIGWAKKWAEVPLRLIMDSVIRVTFPAFSRLQHDRKLIGSAIEKTLFGLSLAIFPISIGLLYYVEPLVSIIPKYGKWQPALFSFGLFIVSSLVASFSTPLTNALNAVGRIKTTLFLMIFWTIATWVLTVLFITYWGFNGVALAMLVLSLSIVIVIPLVKQTTSFRFMKSIQTPLFASIIQIAWYAVLRGSYPYDIGRLIVSGLSGGILYMVIVFVFEKERIREFFSILRAK